MKLLSVLSTALLLFGASASASQPSGTRMGAWDVVGIASLSGAGGGDASAVMAQGQDPDVFEVRWAAGGPVRVSMHVERCSGEEPFDAAYNVPLDRWLRLERRVLRSRLHDDLLTWRAQAVASCGHRPAVDALRVRGLRRAAASFTDLVRGLAGR